MRLYRRRAMVGQGNSSREAACIKGLDRTGKADQGATGPPNWLSDMVASGTSCIFDARLVVLVFVATVQV
jgi:hypothetical protein